MKWMGGVTVVTLASPRSVVNSFGCGIKIKYVNDFIGRRCMSLDSGGNKAEMIPMIVSKSWRWMQYGKYAVASFHTET